MPSGVYKRTAECNTAVSAAAKKRFEDPAEHEKLSAAMKKLYEDPAERAKMSAAKIGKKHVMKQEHYPRISAAQKKYYAKHPEACAAISTAQKKYHAEHPEAKTRENNGNWNGGIGDLPYDQEFTPSFKESVRADGNHTCQLCGKTQEQNGEKLCVHHCCYGKVTKDDMFVALCRSCNGKVNKRTEKDY